MKSCLIIGNGPSKNMIDLNTTYDVDDVIGVHEIYHPQTNIICSVDLRKFWKKEYQAVKNNIPLIIGVCSNNLSFPFYKFHDKTSLIKTKYWRDSGLFSIAWSIENGYQQIYTAGIDWTNQLIINNILYKELDQLMLLNNHIYKCSHTSNMACITKSPPK